MGGSDGPYHNNRLEHGQLNFVLKDHPPETKMWVNACSGRWSGQKEKARAAFIAYPSLLGAKRENSYKWQLPLKTCISLING